MNPKPKPRPGFTRLAAFCLSISLACASGAVAQAETPPLNTDFPVAPLGRVSDYAGVLTPEQADDLSNRLAAFEQRTGAQVVVLIVRSTGGRSIGEYSLLTMNAWGVGRAEYNDGAGIIVAVTDRSARIELGLGLEAFFSNAQAREIMETIMIPAFRRGDIYAGVQQGAQAVMDRIDAGMPAHWRPQAP